jgi:RNA polymerase sigma-19 factor, ECF subfamily
MLREIAQDNEEAFTAIYHHYWNKLYFLAHKHLRSAPAAEEIVQDVFLILWKKRKGLDIHSLPLYLAAMTRYAVYRYLAREKKYQRLNAGTVEPVTANDEKAIDDKLLLEIIEKLSNTLPEKCRLVFIHNKLLDQPLQQVAEQLNISTKTAEAHLTKALKAIRSQLGDALSIFFIF